MTIALWKSPLARVVQGIVKAGNGCWLDQSDMSTMFQDAAGTIPVTTVEQPVGLILDKSQGLMLGPELVSNGDFSNGLTGWTLSAEATVTNSSLQVTSGTNFLTYTNPILTVGKTYIVTFNVTYISGVDIRVVSGTNLNHRVSATTGYKKIYHKADGTVLKLQAAGMEFTGSIDNISVRELYGYHATQSITASRPTLSARYNLLTKTEDITSTDWSVMGVVTRTKNYSTAPDGTLTSQRIVFSDSSNANQFFLRQAIPAGNYSESVFIRVTSGSGKIKFGFYDGQIKTNTYDITEQWQLITYSNLLSSATTRTLWLYPEGAGFATDIQIWHPRVAIGTTPGPYQRINTSTDYDTNPALFPKYLKFDGIDDYLNLPYMGLYANGSASVVAARDEVISQSTTHTMSEGSSVNNSRFYCLTRSLPGYVAINPLIRTDSAVDLIGATLITGSANPLEVRSVVDSGSTLTGYKNTVRGTPATYSRAGATLTLDTTTIGALNYGGVFTDFSDMKLYGLIITKSALTDVQRVRCERFLAQKSGVML